MDFDARLTCDGCLTLVSSGVDWESMGWYSAPLCVYKSVSSERVTLSVNDIYPISWESRWNKMERRGTLTGVSEFSWFLGGCQEMRSFLTVCSSLMSSESGTMNGNLWNCAPE